MFSALAGGVVDWFGFQVAFLFFLTLSAGTALHVWTATFTGALREHQLKEQPKWDQDQGEKPRWVPAGADKQFKKKVF